MLNLQIAFYFLIFSRLQVHTNFIKAYFPIIFFLICTILQCNIAFFCRLSIKFQAYFDKNLQIKKNIRIFAT